MKPRRGKGVSLTFGVETCEWKRLDRRSFSRIARLRCQQYVMAAERHEQCEELLLRVQNSWSGLRRIDFVALFPRSGNIRREG